MAAVLIAMERDIRPIDFDANATEAVEEESRPLLAFGACRVVVCSSNRAPARLPIAEIGAAKLDRSNGRNM